jgi:hypothetical protein
MFRTARVTFHTTRHGGETVTDIFRVLAHDDEEQQDEEIVVALHDAGERDVQIIEWYWL